MTQKPLIDHVQVLMDEFDRSGIRTLHVRVGDFEILLSHDAHAQSLTAPAAGARPVSAPVAAPVATAVPAPVVPAARVTVPEGAVVIAAPNLGTFYRAPKPGAAPYVEVGAIVAEDDEICLIEVMKLFTGVRAGQAGTIAAILAEDGTMVEAGQPLFALMVS
jgi:acetyl-CoA carboxylase biotin carboxyl carrier protein